MLHTAHNAKTQRNAQRAARSAQRAAHSAQRATQRNALALAKMSLSEEASAYCAGVIIWRAAADQMSGKPSHDATIKYSRARAAR